MICGPCSLQKHDIEQTIAGYRYAEPLRTLLHEFKYREGLYLSSFLAGLILDVIPNDAVRPQCLIPVPMHPQRLRQRGYNQAVELAKQLGRALKLPLDVSHCKKIINTAPQASLDADARRKNLRQAFAAKPLPYQHIVLVDDLITTGSTTIELAKVLKSHQETVRVDVWACARTVEGEMGL